MFLLALSALVDNIIRDSFVLIDPSRLYRGELLKESQSEYLNSQGDMAVSDVIHGSRTVRSFASLAETPS